MDYFQASDSTKIAYQYFDGKGTPIVLVHGGVINSSEWQPQQPMLKEYAHLFIDLRGHGLSERKGYPYSIAQFADDLRELLEHLQLENIILCGHSLGGMVAQQFVAQYPELVTKLILADTSFGTRALPLEALQTNLWMPMFNITPVKWQAKFFSDSLGKHCKAAGEYFHQEISKQANDSKNYRAIWKAIFQFNGLEILDKINIPTLVMVGGLFKQTHKQAQIMNERIANSKLVYIEEAGHMLNWDNPKQFNQVMLEFIEG